MPTPRSRGRALPVFCIAFGAHGTTSAVAFPTVHKTSAQALFEQASRAQMRLITGKVLMNRHAPDGLCDDVVQAEHDCVDLIAQWQTASGLCRDGALRCDQHARATGHGWCAVPAMPAPICRPM